MAISDMHCEILVIVLPRPVPHALFRNRNHIFYHEVKVLAVLLDVLESIFFLKVIEFIWCDNSIALCEFEAELSFVSRGDKMFRNDEVRF